MAEGRAKLKKLVEQLSAIKGRHTELVTVYVPAGYSLVEISNQLRQEAGTAENIKSKAVRKNVVSALEKVVQHLKLYKKAPENGLAIFCGNVSEKEGVDNLQLWAIEPPEELRVRLYWCDQRFDLAPLQDMFEEKEVYGLLAFDSREATFAILRGKRVDILANFDSIVPSKFKAGGQCLTPDALVKTPVGLIPIKNLQVGQDVISYDFISKKEMISKVIDKWKIRKNKVLKIKTDTSEINCSEDHVLFDHSGNVVVAKECSVGSNLAFEGGKSSVKSIDFESEEMDLIDISVEAENFIANGLIVHNSAQRFERVRDGMVNDWFKKIGEQFKNYFEDEKIKGVIVGGPGPIKDSWLDGDFINEPLKAKIIGVKNIGYTGEHGIEELLNRSDDVLKEMQVAKEKAVLKRFFDEVYRAGGKAVYGLEKVEKALSIGAADIVLVSEKTGMIEAEYLCSCGNGEKRLVKKEEKNSQKCSRCSSNTKLVGEGDLFEYFDEKVKQTGASAMLISSDTKEGEAFFNIGGIGAILRYAF